MGRKKKDEVDKKIHFGISIHPELAILVDKQSKKEGENKSKFIEKVIKKYLDENDKK